MYIPGRLRTASRPSRTLMSPTSYATQRTSYQSQMCQELLCTRAADANSPEQHPTLLPIDVHGCPPRGLSHTQSANAPSSDPPHEEAAPTQADRLSATQPCRH